MENDKQLIIVILAGGHGTRMESHKTTHALLEEVGGIPILVRVINEASRLNPRKMIVVVGDNDLVVRRACQSYAITSQIEFINQGPALGTGYAIQMCRNKLRRFNGSRTLIISGNAPLITHKIMRDIVDHPGDVIIPYITTDDSGDAHKVKVVKGRFSKMILHDECSVKDLTIKSVGVGIMCVETMALCSNVDFISCVGKSNEYHMEEVVNIIKKREDGGVSVVELPLLHYIKVRRVRTVSELKNIDDYVDALSLI